MPGFTPVQSTVGGLLIGAAAVGKFVYTGRILGVSGIIRGLWQGDWSPWRWVFTLGLASGSGIVAWLIPGAFETIAIPGSRAAIGGFLVGLGSSMGNGCTSGHGICGNARLSKRSMVYTMVFMVSGFITAALAGTAEAFGLANSSPQYMEPSAQFILKAGVLFPAALGAMVLVPLIFMRPKEKEEVQAPKAMASMLAEYFTGTVFGMGLGLSGMTLPTKIAAFLSILHPGFDPSLMFVMGGALLVALPCFQYIVRSPKWTKPICRTDFNLPKKKNIDGKLLLGGALFGMGWGISGMCPGPALANLVNPSTSLALYMGGLGVGFLSDYFIASPIWKRVPT